MNTSHVENEFTFFIFFFAALSVLVVRMVHLKMEGQMFDPNWVLKVVPHGQCTQTFIQYLHTQSNLYYILQEKSQNLQFAKAYPS